MPRLPEISLPMAAAFLVLFAVGIWTRVSSSEAFHGVGLDEQYYQKYVGQFSEGGLSYPAMVQKYLEEQRRSTDGLPTPTRVTLVLAASAWHVVFGTNSLESVRAVSCLASILTLLAATAFAWRVRSAGFALALLALLTFSPTQLYMAHRALADSCMCLVVVMALWSLWELLWLKSAGRLIIISDLDLRGSVSEWIWRVIFGASLFLMVLTKENAAFPFLGIAALVVGAWWFKLGRVDWPLVLITVLAPLAGVVVLCFCAGGWSMLADVYSLVVTKSLGTPYAIAAEDGPWFRYIVDHLLANPVVVMLAVAGAVYLTREELLGIYLLTFVVVSYIPMCNVPHGQNLRYATIWDVPLTYLALLPIFRWAQWPSLELLRRVLLIAIISVVALSEIENYCALFVDNPIYDPVTAYLMQALKMITARTQ